MCVANQSTLLLGDQWFWPLIFIQVHVLKQNITLSKNYLYIHGNFFCSSMFGVLVPLF